MNLDNTRFLLVAGVLSMSTGLCAVMVGCSSKSDDTPAPLPHDDDASAPSADPTDRANPGSGGPGRGGEDPAKGGSTDGGGSKDGDAAKAAACLDDSSPAAQPACPGAGECQGACDNFLVDYKKGLSADIRKCLTATICMASTATCADKALAKACADPTATTFCTPMVMGCKGSNPADTMTQAMCEGVAKGLTATGRDVLKHCFENEAVCGDCIAMLK